MTARRCLLLVLPALVTALVASDVAVTAARPGLSLTVDRVAISTKLGRKFTFRTTIANPGPSVATGVIAHLNVLSLGPAVYVDPEDWSSRRTRYLVPIRPGGSTTISWKLQAVNAGGFAVYVVALSHDGSTLLAAGRPVRLTVLERRTLDAGGIVPLVIGVPALLALVWLGLRLRRSRAAATQA